MIREAQERRAKAELEGKLLEALEAEATSMGTADWDQLRERVRRIAAEQTGGSGTMGSKISSGPTGREN